MHRYCKTVAAISLSLASSTAVAQQPVPKPRVLLLAERGTERERNFVLGDLQARGYEVLDAPDGEPAASATARMDAMAALRIRDGGLIEIWVSGPSLGAATLRDMVAPYSSADEARTDAVVRALELLRAHLIEVHPPPRALEPEPRRSSHSGQPQAAPDRAPQLPGQRVRIGISAGAGWLKASGGVGAALGVPVEIRILPAPGWGLAAGVFLPVRSGSLSAPEADATVSPTLMNAGFWACPWSGGWLAICPEAGLSVAVLSMSAEANAGYVGHAGTALTGIAWVGAEVSIPLASSLALRAGGRGGATIPGDRIRFVGREVATWGPLVATGSISAEWVF